MSYVRNNLLAGETVAYETRLHWVVLLGPAAFAAMVAALGIAIVIFGTRNRGNSEVGPEVFVWVGAVFLAVAGILVVYGIIRRGATEMAVTNKRVLVKVGLVGRKSIEILLSRIESIGVNETAMGRMLGYGTVIVRGIGGTPEPFDRIAHPVEFRRHVQQQIESYQPLSRNP